MSELVIRPITKDDIAACLDIYNYEVVNGVATVSYTHLDVYKRQG